MGRRKEIILIDTHIKGVRVVAKQCTGCNEILPLENYHNSKHGLGGKSSKCKECYSKYVKKYNKTDQIKNRVFTKGGIKFKKCNVCNNEKPISDFYPHGISYTAQCKDCYKKLKRKGTAIKKINIVSINGVDSKECRLCGKTKPL